MNTETHRTAKAFLIAPLIVPLAFLLPLPGEDNSGHSSIWTVVPAIFMMSIFYVLPLAYLAELLLGLPAWIVFRHYRIRSVFAFAAGGAFLGLIFYVVMEALVGNFRARPLALEFNPLESPYLNVDVIAGFSSAVLFRAILFSGQPPSASERRNS